MELRLDIFFGKVKGMQSFFSFAFLRDFVLRQERLSSDLPPHLVHPCYVALGRPLIWGLYPDWLRPLSIGFPPPRLGPTVDREGVTALSLLEFEIW